MNNRTHITNWLYSVATVAWVGFCLGSNDYHDHVTDPIGDTYYIMMAILYAAFSPILYWCIWKSVNIISNWLTSKLATKNIVTKVEVIREVIPSPSIIIKNMNVNDSVVTEENT